MKRMFPTGFRTVLGQSTALCAKLRDCICQLVCSPEAGQVHSPWSNRKNTSEFEYSIRKCKSVFELGCI